jgi:hypothetical protein
MVLRSSRNALSLPLSRSHDIRLTFAFSFWVGPLFKTPEMTPPIAVSLTFARSSSFARLSVRSRVWKLLSSTGMCSVRLPKAERMAWKSESSSSMAVTSPGAPRTLRNAAMVELLTWRRVTMLAVIESGSIPISGRCDLSGDRPPFLYKGRIGSDCSRSKAGDRAIRSPAASFVMVFRRLEAL